MCLPPWLGKILRFTALRLLGNSFEKLFLPLVCPALVPMLQIHNHFAPKKLVPPCKAFVRKKSPITFGGGRRHYALSSYLFLFLKDSSLTFVVQTISFQAKLPSQYVFKVIRYGYEIFQTVELENHIAKNI